MGELLLSEKKGIKTYLVENTEWGANVIRKVLDKPYPNDVEVRKFLQEFKLLKLLDFPGVRKPASIDNDADQPTAYYEYFDGFTLKKLIENGKNDLSLALSTGLFLAEVLSELHKRKIIHKNISANNILYNPSSQAFNLIDFSIASTIKEKKNLYGNATEVNGELEYISPEQTGRINRRVDHRSDFYSIGIVLYELVTGSLPFSEKNSRETIYGHIAIIPEPPIEQNPSVPKALSGLIMKLLEKDADDRYRSANGIKEDLLRIQSEFVKGTNEDFELAQYDRAITLTISQKLYGRQDELLQLNTHLQEVATGGFGIDLVFGHSGSGKSALVNEAFKTLGKRKGYFLSGKFDQLQRNIPYYAIRNALREYFDFLLKEEGQYIDTVRQRILENVGSDSALLIEIVPELEHIIGRQPDVEKAAGIAGQNRFNYAFNNFLKAITDAERPIVLFLDDLQWADLASLNLISNIIHDKHLHYLLLIGSYRENEVSEAHPLLQLVRQSEKDGVIIQHLKVENLSEDDIISLLADSLTLTADEVKSLGKMLFNHTDGNAFYTTQIIQSLYEQDKLFYDELEQKWLWDKNAISGIDIPDTVVELMIQRVKRLDKVTQELLMKGSCFGNSFTTSDLEYLLDSSVEEFDKSIIEAQEEGYIHGENELFFFTHDRIQQAVYALIDENDKKKIHFEIGLQLLEKYGDNEEKIFDVVDQVNFGIDDLEDEDAKVRYAQLNLRAGQLAKSAIAYDASIRYLETGLLFAQNDWTNQYSLVLALNTHLAESCYLLGKYDILVKLTAEVLKNARELLDEIPIYKLEVEALKSQNNLYAAVEKGIEVLGKLDVKLPYEPGTLMVFRRLIITRIKMLGKNPKNLIDLPEMSDPYMLAAMQVLVSIGPAVYWASPNLTPITIFKMLLISVKHGNTDESTFAYSTYGLLLCGVTGEIKLGNAFGKLSLDLAQKVNPINRVKGVFNVYCFVHHWSHPLTDSFKPFKEAHLLGLEAGDLEFSALSAYLYCNHAYYAGVPLPELENDFKNYSQEIRRIQQFTSLNYNLIHWQTAYNLLNDTSNPVELKGPVYDEASMLDKHLEANDKTALFKYHLQKMILNYLFGNESEAHQHGLNGANYIDAVTGMYVTVAYYFYFGLTLVAVARLQDGNDGGKSPNSQIRSILKKLKKWAHHSPVNNQHKYELLQAEYYCLKGKPTLAASFYKKSIQSAQVNSFINELAIANELTGRFYVRQHDEDISKFYLTNAYITYERWGAKAKCKELLFTHKLDSFIDSFAKSLNQGFTLSSTNTLEKIDIGAITEVSETISDEIDYDQLKRLLLKILAENAGAEKAILFLVRNKITSLEDSWPDKRSSTQAFASSILDKALDTGDIVVTDRAESDIYFKQDDHVTRNKVRSALCLPLYHRNELIAIVYLENNVVYGAFSPNRLEFLKLLSGQIAISLKNATLYKNLADSYDQQVELKEAYSKFVPMDFLNFLSKDSIIDVTLGDQIQETVTVMFIDIVDYTTLSEQMTPKENFDFINGALRRIGPIMRKYKGVISQFLGDGAMAIFKDSADDALHAAIGIQKAIDAYNIERKEKGRSSIGLGIGIHTGKVMLGIIGEKMRMDQNVISDNVNIASRVQDLTRTYHSNILFTGSSMAKLAHKEEFKVRYLGTTKVKGRENEIEIYECLDAQNQDEIERKLNSNVDFSEALNSFYANKYEETLVALEKVIEINPEDGAAKLFIERSRKLVE